MISIGVFSVYQEQNKNIQLLIKRFFKKKELIKLDVFSDVNKMIDQIYNFGTYDIIIFDLDQTKLSSINQSSAIIHQSEKSFLIYLSKNKNEAYEALKLGAIDYILKPIIEEDLLLALEKSYQLICKNNYHFIVCKTNDGYKKINLKDIKYIECDHHYQYINLINQEKIKIRSTIRELEDEILKQTTSFIKCHSAFIVNMDFIKEVKGNLITLNDKTTIPISRNFKSKFKENIKEYYTKN